MIVEALYQFGKNHDLIPSALVDHRVTHIVDLDSKGKFLDIIAEKAIVCAPKHGKRSGTTPKPYLLDKATYTFGRGGRRAAASEAQHQAFCGLVQELWDETREPLLKAVMVFLGQPLPKTIQEVAWKGAEKIAFRVGGTFIYNTPKIRAYFEAQLDDGDPTHTCMVTGKPCTPIFQPRLKYLPGSQGATLVTFNSPTSRFQGADAVESYPLSREVQEGAVAAWNHLTEPQEFGRRSAIVLSKATGNTKEPMTRPITAFWTSTDADLTPFLDLLRGYPFEKALTPEERRPLFKARLAASREALRALEGQGGWLFGLTLQAFQGRAAVQDWVVLPLASAAANLQKFFDRTYVGTVWSLLRMIPSYEEGLIVLRSILFNQPFPSGLVKLVLDPNPICWPEEGGRAPLPLLMTVQAYQGLQV